MTTNNEAVVCECGHVMIAHENGNNCLARTNQWTPTYCPCDQFTDSRLAALWAENERLQAEVARLTPRMVGELPTRAGCFHHICDNGTTEIIKAIAYGGSRGTRYQIHGNDIEFTKSDFASGLWSAEPIPMPGIEKEETA